MVMTLIVISVDGRHPAPGENGALSHYSWGFNHPRWCKISSTHSMIITGITLVDFNGIMMLTIMVYYGLIMVY